MDPWGVDNKGNLDVQLSHSLWKRLKDDLPNCKVTIDNLEAYMQEMDQDILQKRESSEVGWFKDYVSQVLKVPITIEMNLIFLVCDFE